MAPMLILCAMMNTPISSDECETSRTTTIARVPALQGDFTGDIDFLPGIEA